MNYKSIDYILERIAMLLGVINIFWLNAGIANLPRIYIPRNVKICLCVTWILLALVSNKEFAKKIIPNIYLLVLFYALTIIITLGIKDIKNIYITSIPWLIMVYLLFIYIFDEKYIKLQKIIIGVLIIDYIVIGINTFIYLRNSHDLSRFLSTAEDLRKAFLGDTAYPLVGNYGFFYSLVGIILLLTFMFLNNLGNKLLILLATMCALALLIKGTFVTAIILAGICITLLLVTKITGKHRYILLGLIFVAAILIFSGLASRFFDSASKISWLPEAIVTRFDQIAQFLSGADMGNSDISARLSLYGKALESFFSNIFIGGTKTSNGHSTWLDMLALMGICSIPFIVFIAKAYKYIIIRVQEKYIAFVKIYWIYFVILGLINPVLFPRGLVMWFIFLPLSVSLLEHRKEA